MAGIFAGLALLLWITPMSIPLFALMLVGWIMTLLISSKFLMNRKRMGKQNIVIFVAAIVSWVSVFIFINYITYSHSYSLLHRTCMAICWTVVVFIVIFLLLQAAHEKIYHDDACTASVWRICISLAGLVIIAFGFMLADWPILVLALSMAISIWGVCYLLFLALMRNNKITQREYWVTKD